MFVPNRGRPWAVIVGLAVAALLFAALGDWQLHRLAWKQALIARVAQAGAAPPLGFAALQAAAPASLEYHRAVLAGHYDPASTTLVTATSELGSGYWDMVTLRAGAAAIWVNRGFVPEGSRRASLAALTPTGPVTVRGRARLTEPGGTWLRANRPDLDRWYSRDLPAMARARHLAESRSPIFIDAQDESPRTATAPVPGLTVLHFPNNHLGYAVTWLALALLSGAVAGLLSRRPS